MLSEYLPEDVIYLMIVEFSCGLRNEITKLQEKPSELRYQGLTDMGMMVVSPLKPPKTTLIGGITLYIAR